MAEENYGFILLVWTIITDFFAELPTTNLFLSVTNFTMKEDVKDSVLNGWNSNDWQIRLCYVLLVWTMANLVGILFAWLRFGKSVSEMFYNKPKTPSKKHSDQISSSDNLEDLIKKKIQ